MKKLFACDLDGTLLPSSSKTEDIIIEMIKEVNRTGNYFTVATGRPMCPNNKAAMGFSNGESYVICCNGAHIIDRNENSLFEYIMPKDFIVTLTDAFPDIKFEFFTKEKILTQYSMEEKFKSKINYANMNDAARSSYARDYVFNQSIEDILKADVYKINFNVLTEDVKTRMDAFLNKHTDTVLNAPYNISQYELTPTEINKGKAIDILAEKLGVEKENIYVYGDGLNDIAMLEAYENSYATSNACDKAKEAARHTIGSCDEYAVVKHILETIKS